MEWLVSHKLASSPLTLDPRGRALNYIELAGRTEGYSVSDLGDLVDRAVQEAVVRSLATGEGQVRTSSPRERNDEGLGMLLIKLLPYRSCSAQRTLTPRRKGSSRYRCETSSYINQTSTGQTSEVRLRFSCSPLL